MKRIIWLFREPRSGSTWLTRKLVELTGRDHVFIEQSMMQLTMDRRLADFRNRVQSDRDFDCILSTHHFMFLECIENYTNPVLIRTARKDVTEQFISHFLAELTEWRHPNLHPEGNVDDIVNLFAEIGTGHIVPRRKVENYMRQKKEWDRLWDQYAASYENCTVYYEDMSSSFDLPLINLTGLQMKEVDTTMPMPYNKREIIRNYDQIDRWIKELL